MLEKHMCTHAYINVGQDDYAQLENAEGDDDVHERHIDF